MTLWFAALLGLVQGLTEFIPVSSNAHLRITNALFHQSDEGGAAFTAVLQLGSLAAVLAYFAKDLYEVTIALFTKPNTPEGRLPLQLAVGTVPIVIAGLLLRKVVENDLRSIYIVAGALIVVGIAMAFIDQHASGRDENRPLASLTYKDALIVGLAQTLALCPGVSRSGSTICMALLLGFARSDAARFSFLLSIPAVAGAGILESRAVFAQYPLAPIAVGIGVAAVTSYGAIAWLIKFLGQHRLVGFAIYRVAVGIALIGAVLANLIEAT